MKLTVGNPSKAYSSSKTVLSAFCIIFGDLINDFCYFIEQFGNRKIKFILFILYAI